MSGNAKGMKRIGHQVAIALFGMILPVLILAQAYLGVSSLKAGVAYTASTTQVATDYFNVRKELKTANDYALFSLMYVEHANQKTMTNKQVMKATIVLLGFAVISVGMMLIVLGINEGAIEAGGKFAGVSFDLKTGSTGAAIFVVGALMATLGGVLKNDYSTSRVPLYGEFRNENYNKSVNAYKSCYAKKEEEPQKCFANLFEQINKGVLEQ